MKSDIETYFFDNEDDIASSACPDCDGSGGTYDNVPYLNKDNITYCQIIFSDCTNCGGSGYVDDYNLDWIE